MSRILFIGDAWSSFATCTDANVVSGFGAGTAVPNGQALTDINPKIHYQTLNNGTGFVEFTSPSRLIDTIWLGFGNPSATGSYEIRAAVTQGEIFSSPLINTGSLSIWPESGLEDRAFVHAIYRHPTPVAVGALRIDFDDAAAMDSTLRIGRMMVDLAFEPQVNFSHAAGYGTGWIDNSVITTMMDGTISIDVRERRGVAQYTPIHMPQSDRREFLRMNRLYGSSHPMVVVENIDATVGIHEGMIHGLIQWAQIPVQSDVGGNRFKVPISIQEMGA